MHVCWYEHDTAAERQVFHLFGEQIPLGTVSPILVSIFSGRIRCTKLCIVVIHPRPQTGDKLLEFADMLEMDIACNVVSERDAGTETSYDSHQRYTA